MELREHKGKTYIRDFCFEEIAEKYGTPFYLYDMNVIKEKIADFRKEFEKSIELYYAMKANPNLEILKAIRDDVDGLDISSSGELKQALLAGYDPSTLSFAGPGKTRDELKEAIKNGVGIISVESLRELRDIKAIASENDLRANTALRVNPKLFIKEFAIKMGGKATQFGIDEEDFSHAIDYLKKNKVYFHFLGIHIYSGTQCMSEKAIAKNMKNTLEIASDFHTKYDIECKIINLGGGFGVSYYGENQEIDLCLIAELLKKPKRKCSDSLKNQPRLIIELGRYIGTEAGIYVSRIVSEKQSMETKFYIIDGGMNHHLAASGNLGAIIRKNYMLKNLSRPGKQKEKCNLVGPLCTPLDLMGKNISIEAPNLGDLVGFLNSGSYSFTASPILFLGHETPLELMIYDDEIKVIRGRKNMIDFN